MAESGSAVAESPLSGLPDSILNEVSFIFHSSNKVGRNTHIHVYKICIKV